MSVDLTRRDLLRGGAGTAAALALASVQMFSRAAWARGRTPFGGKLAFHLPWPLASIDPHRLDDPAAAILGEALFDSLYIPTASGFAPAVADAPPAPHPRGLRVAIRTGLKTAHGRPLDARDVLHSLERARSHGARGWLAGTPAPRLDGHDAVIFSVQDATNLQRVLASPLTAIVPTAFVPETPDGTGPFRAELRDGGIALNRNEAAARGGAFLESIAIHPASDLSSSLRAFETGTDDLGWLGLGLHEPRANAKPFDAGAVGWAVLATGRDAGTWDRPGIAQALTNAIPYARLADLQVGPAWPEASGSSAGWGGPPSTLIVRDDAPWLVELARVVAAAIGTPGHEVTSKPVPAAEIVRRRAARDLALAIDVTRPLAGGAWGALMGLATADEASVAEALGRHPPRVPEGSARALTRQMRVGVVGEIRAQGGRVGDVVLPISPFGTGLDLGAAYRSRGA